MKQLKLGKASSLRRLAIMGFFWRWMLLRRGLRNPRRMRRWAGRVTPTVDPVVGREGKSGHGGKRLVTKVERNVARTTTSGAAMVEVDGARKTTSELGAALVEAGGEKGTSGPALVETDYGKATTSWPALVEADAARTTTSEVASLEADAAGATTSCAALVLGPSGREAELRLPWATLLSKHPEVSNLWLRGLPCKFGVRGCEIYLDDGIGSPIFCQIENHKNEGICEMEVLGRSGFLHVNGIPIGQQKRQKLKGGDEISFGAPACATRYVFHHPLKDNVHKAERICLSALAFKDSLRREIISPNDIEVTLDNFPYYISAKTNMQLISSGLIHMKNKGLKSHLPRILSIDERILLSGPEWSEIYKETLVKALAKHFHARLLIIDSITLCDVPESQDNVKGNDLRPSSSADLGTSLPHTDSYHKHDSANGLCGRNTFKEGDRVLFVGSNSLRAFQAQNAQRGLPPGVPYWGPPPGSQGKVLLIFAENPHLEIGVRFNHEIPDGVDLGGLCEAGHGFFCHADELLPDTSNCEVDISALSLLIEVISDESQASNFIVLIKDVGKTFSEYTDTHSLLRQLPPGVLIIGSYTQTNHGTSALPRPLGSYQSTFEQFQSHLGGFPIPRAAAGDQIIHNNFAKMGNQGDAHDISGTIARSLAHIIKLFPNYIPIEFPESEKELLALKKQLEYDAETIKAKANIRIIHEFITNRRIECNDLDKLRIKDEVLNSEIVDKIVGHAIGYVIQQIEPNVTRSSIVLSVESIEFGVSMVRDEQNVHKRNKKSDVITYNELEEKLLSSLILPDQVRVSFEDIGALDSVKNTLKKLIMVPLQRPELFGQGKVKKGSKGILLFGPPGTGKTMLAMAVATEAGAKFINVSVSDLITEWFKEGEKYVKALFSLACKLSPSVIFIDEVDSLLGKGEITPEPRRLLRNQFMLNWDGVAATDQVHVVVLGATNKRYHLDESVIRRFPCRLMVSLPDAPNREKILKVILFEETLASDVDLSLVAKLTDGYSASELRNLCEIAIGLRIHEMVDKEGKEKNMAIAEGRPEPPPYDIKDVRPVEMNDFKCALPMVRASVSWCSEHIEELIRWNTQFCQLGELGDGNFGQRRHDFYT